MQPNLYQVLTLPCIKIEYYRIFSFAMIAKYTCFWIVLIVLDKTGQCQDVQNYNISLTWMNATSKCGTDGLEHDATILSNLSILRQKQFWIGIGIYKKITPWMEVLGCYQLPEQEQRDIFLESSTGLCLWKCNNTKYFSYKKHLTECMCLNHVKEDTYFRSKLSLDKCTKYNKSEAVLVHEVFDGDYQRSGNGDDDEMCMTFMCNGNQPQLYETNCMNTNGGIQGLCEDRHPSSNDEFWGLPYSTQLENCKKRQMLLAHSNVCMHGNIWNKLWTNIFREYIEVEVPGGDNSRIPVRCLSAKISVTEIKDLQISQENCTSRLNWFVCKKGTSSSTTPRQSVFTIETREKVTNTTFKIDEASTTSSSQSVPNLAKESSASFDIGPVIGGIAGAFALLAVLFVMIFCKIRSCGVFKTTNTDKQGLQFATTAYEHSQNPAMRTSVTPTSNESYGITSINSINTYAVVNKIKKTDSKLQNSDKTYIETSYGEYDRLNGVSKRRVDSKENLYDSHAGIRNENAPTYDSSNFEGRKLQLDNDVYDHTDTISTDGYSSTVRTERRNENDVYD